MIRTTAWGRAPARAVAGAVADLSARADGDTWLVERRLSTTSAVAVATVRADARAAVLKVALDDRACRPLLAQQDVLSVLHADERLGQWRRLLPELIAHGQVAGRSYLLEQRLPGGGPRPDRTGLTERALSAIRELHRRSGVPTVVEEQLLTRWVDEPVEQLRRAVTSRPRPAWQQQALDRLRLDLRTGLTGRRVRAGWIHGDFWPGNVLIGPDGAVTGIIDWGQADSCHLGVVDVAHWLLAVEPGPRYRELGARVTARLAGRRWSAAERAWLLDAQPDDAQPDSAQPDSAQPDSAQPDSAQDPIGEDVVLLLAWLNHAVCNLHTSPAYAASRIWMSRNVAPVLRWLADG